MSHRAQLLLEASYKKSPQRKPISSSSAASSPPPPPLTLSNEPVGPPKGLLIGRVDNSSDSSQSGSFKRPMEQIDRNQEEEEEDVYDDVASSISGNGEHRFVTNDEVQALYLEDGNWYDAEIMGRNRDGERHTYDIRFVGFDNDEGIETNKPADEVASLQAYSEAEQEEEEEEEGRMITPTKGDTMLANGKFLLSKLESFEESKNFDDLSDLLAEMGQEDDDLYNQIKEKMGGTTYELLFNAGEDALIGLQVMKAFTARKMWRKIKEKWRIIQLTEEGKEVVRNTKIVLKIIIMQLF